MPLLVTFLSSGKMRVSVTVKGRPSRRASTSTEVPCVWGRGEKGKRVKQGHFVGMGAF